MTFDAETSKAIKNDLDADHTSLIENLSQEIVSWVTVKWINQYNIVKYVDQGSFGKVMQIENKQTGCISALKKFYEWDNRFRGLSSGNIREVMIMRNLDHKNVVKFSDLCYNSDTKRGGRRICYFLVMEFCDFNLHEIIRKLYLYPDSMTDVMFQLTTGVHYIHECGIVHRDLKPRNILVTSFGTVKIGDFGSAMYNVAWVPGRKRPVDRAGTRWYKAPEILSDTESVHGASVDMWGLGCILAELYCKKTIMKGDCGLDQLRLIVFLCGGVDQALVERYPGYKSVANALSPERRVSQKFGGVMCKDKDALALLEELLVLDPNVRPTAQQVLNHAYIRKRPNMDSNWQGLAYSLAHSDAFHQ